jgi:hypothetical protein
MDIGLTRNQESAAEKLSTIAPFIHLARQAFVARTILSTIAESEIFEAAARNKGLTLAKAILMLKHDLKRVITHGPVCTYVP